ncbi:zinc finger MYM-type protein 1-like [Corticium candelabrum]|uniref:zinc finger MYM-type protein 1-like n=1 Tax=Corticium candelabrum TaxID=121492 RepID=UPI002E253BC3|nr:zinc finger MYM-type protein 1-like [Corticium candelabrum]
MADWPAAYVRVDKFHPPKTFRFPRRKFGSKGETRSFKAEWCEKFDWLHYDASADAAFCHVCMSAELEKKFLASTKKDHAFISKGFTNWKEATIAFKKHLASACHREAVSGIQDLPKHVHDVGELLDSQHRKEKALNRDMFRRVLQNVCFLARQGLALRGHCDSAESNFKQLMRLKACDCAEVLEWMDKKTNKYTSPDIQNECLLLMALHILRQVSNSSCRNGFYTIMADECTDVANKEQFTICIRWVDDSLTDHEDVIGLYNVGTIDTNCLAVTIRDVFLRMKMTLCRGQCYDGASNMTGSKHGVATQLQAEESRAILTHCYGHALILAIGDAMKQSKICRDALDTHGI